MAHSPVGLRSYAGGIGFDDTAHLTSGCGRVSPKGQHLGVCEPEVGAEDFVVDTLSRDP